MHTRSLTDSVEDTEAKQAQAVDLPNRRLRCASSTSAVGSEFKFIHSSHGYAETRCLFPATFPSRDQTRHHTVTCNTRTAFYSSHSGTCYSAQTLGCDWTVRCSNPIKQEICRLRNVQTDFEA
jgi:hypothetical protein